MEEVLVVSRKAFRKEDAAVHSPEFQKQNCIRTLNTLGEKNRWYFLDGIYGSDALCTMGPNWYQSLIHNFSWHDSARTQFTVAF